MKIESKATKAIHYISKEDYAKMDTYKKRLYTVLDSSDRLIPSIEVKEIKIAQKSPLDVFEADFKKEVEQVMDECTRADIKEMLDEQELAYKRDDVKEVLAEIYVKWKTENY